jgi:hypothetical protein
VSGLSAYRRTARVTYRRVVFSKRLEY